MTDSQTAAQDLGLQLHQLVAQLEPARWRDDARAELAAKFETLRANFETTAAQLDSSPLQDTRAAFENVISTLQGNLPNSSDLRDRWMEFRKEIHPRYEELAKALRAHHVDLPSLRPTNYTRSITHVISGFVGLFFVEFTHWNIVMVVALGFAVMAWTLEITRHNSKKWNDILMWILGPIAHPHERHRVNSATWYATALGILAFTESPAACAAGVMALGLGDPAAALIGRRWGKTKIIHNRSLEGATAFVVVAATAVFAAFLVFHPEIPLTTKLIAAAVAALVGAITELYSGKIDDNFSIPLFTGLATWATLGLLG